MQKSLLLIIARTFNNKLNLQFIKQLHKKLITKKEFKESKQVFQTMMSTRQPQLKMNRGIILFQVYSGKSTPICISVSQTASLEDLHQKVDSILFLNKYSSFEEKSNERSFFEFSSKKKTNIHRIFARCESTNEFLTINSSDRTNVVDFMDKKQRFFVDYSQLPQLHNLYRIYVIDNNDYKKYKEDGEEFSIVNTLKKLTTCFA